jgi:hypothetical protein
LTSPSSGSRATPSRRRWRWSSQGLQQVCVCICVCMCRGGGGGQVAWRSTPPRRRGAGGCGWLWLLCWQPGWRRRRLGGRCVVARYSLDECARGTERGYQQRRRLLLAVLVWPCACALEELDCMMLFHIHPVSLCGEAGCRHADHSLCVLGSSWTESGGLCLPYWKCWLLVWRRPGALSVSVAGLQPKVERAAGSTSLTGHAACFHFLPVTVPLELDYHIPVEPVNPTSPVVPTC